MNKYLITGFSGFVSQHFLDFLERNEEKCEVLGLDINPPQFDTAIYRTVHCSFVELNLLNAEEVKNILLSFKPDYILHLASYSSVAYSWQQPVTAFVNNLNIFLNLVDQVRLLQLTCRILSVGSSEEYGAIHRNELPLREEMKVDPLSPYAVARVSQEQLSGIYCTGYGLDIVMTRSFNHIGPGQLDKFAIPSFVRKLLAIQKTGNTFIEVGNIDIVRDFVDVRDVVKAYFLLLKHGERGNIYNVCSGQGYTLREILSKLMGQLNLSIELRTDPQLVRPSDNDIIIGSYDKIEKAIGWKPTITIDDSLSAIINYWAAK